MNKFISQYTADGFLTEFAFNFNIVQDRSVNVYITPYGEKSDEDKNIVNPNNYVVKLNKPQDELSNGYVVFNQAPNKNDIITITPDDSTDITIKFSNTTALDQNNLNKAYNQQSSTISLDFENFKTSSIRYNINENESNINYDNKVPPLLDGSFWRREKDKIIAQSYDNFILEVSNSITNFTNELEQVTISKQTGNTFSLDDFTSGDISQDTLEVFKNGLKLSISGEYVINSTNNTITFNVPLVNNDIVYIIKPLVKESNTFMDVEGNNAIFTNNSKLASRDLKNVDISSYPLATDQSLGISQKSTQIITNEGTDNNLFITSLQLRTLLNKIVEPVGSIIEVYDTVAPNNYLVIDGTHWSKSKYPELWNFLNGKPNVSNDDTNFWIENSQGRFTRAIDSKNILGSIHDDGIRNITGSFNSASRNNPNPKGAFKLSSNLGAPFSVGSDQGSEYTKVFDASLVVPVADENQPMGICFLKCIKYTLGF